MMKLVFHILNSDNLLLKLTTLFNIYNKPNLFYKIDIVIKWILFLKSKWRCIMDKSHNKIKIICSALMQVAGPMAHEVHTLSLTFNMQCESS